MKRCAAVCLLLYTFLIALCAQAQTLLPSLRGIVTDPSGSTVPAALVQVVGPRGELRQGTGSNGEYVFPSLAAGKYQIRFIAKGFTLGQKSDIDISAPVTLDYQLAIEANSQVINVEDEANTVSVDPSKNADAITIGQTQIDALSDDPDVLQQQLIALAGPGAGPNGGQIYVDGFSGAQLPPKSSIQEIRINSNPYSPENENAGGSGIQIITKPGTSTLHGNIQNFYNKEALNSRNPLLRSSKRPPLKSESVSGNLSGSLVKNKLSYTFNFNKNALTQNAFVYATVLDNDFKPVPVNQTVLTPRGNWNWFPRIDYSINSKNTLTASFFNGHNHIENLGTGDYGLPSRAYNNHGNNNQLQISETAILSSRMVTDTRFQYFRNLNDNTGDSSTPSILVPGAFSGGGAQIGNSGATTSTYEINSSTSFGYKAHTLRWGGRLRESFVYSTSVTNFGGTYTFQGGSGVALDSNNQPIPGTSVLLTALEVYRRTLIFQQQGLNDAAIRALGGGAYQFSLGAGQPALNVKQFDAGLFFVDDWRARPNVTFSYGLRYEVQSNMSDHHDWAPRIAVAWNPTMKGGKPGKTVLRAGLGTFYSRVPLAVTQNAFRFNGVTQQSFVAFSPSFFPAIPSTATLQASHLPQQVQILDSAMQAPQSWQGSVGADRQMNKAVRLSVNYSINRGVHIQRTRDINAPLNGVFPFGDSRIRLLTEPTAFSRTQQITVTPTVNYKTLFLAGFYTLSYGKTDAEGNPADPYNLRAEWGPATQADVRHRAVVIFTSPLPTKYLKKFTLTAQASFQSGTPYNLTVGRDLNGDSFITERPSLLPGIAAATCTGSTLKFEPRFGCFNLNPAPGTAIGRNFARGPAQENVSYASIARTWVLNPGKEGAGKEGMVTVPGPGGTSVTVPASMVGGLNLPNGSPKRKYSLTFSVNAQNPLNHTTYSVPSGDLSSPFFGVFRSTSFGSTWNRQVSLQLRLAF
jgi:hypothetical protein